jgi:hypothetical protein
MGSRRAGARRPVRRGLARQGGRPVTPVGRVGLVRAEEALELAFGPLCESVEPEQGKDDEVGGKLDDEDEDELEKEGNGEQQGCPDAAGDFLRLAGLYGVNGAFFCGGRVGLRVETRVRVCVRACGARSARVRVEWLREERIEQRLSLSLLLLLLTTRSVRRGCQVAGADGSTARECLWRPCQRRSD